MSGSEIILSIIAIVHGFLFLPLVAGVTITKINNSRRDQNDKQIRQLR